MRRLSSILTTVSGLACAGFLLLWIVSYFVCLESKIELGDDWTSRSFRAEWGTLGHTERYLVLCAPPPYTGYRLHFSAEALRPTDQLPAYFGLTHYESGVHGYHGPMSSSTSIPMWLPTLLSAGICYGSVRIGRWLSVVPGLCPACGYDLRATPGRCPECGRAAEAE